MERAQWPLPTIIQGGMGVAISHWRLARAVARRGQLGVISGTAIERVLACRLQEGDPGGNMRWALARLPDHELAEQILASWFQPDGLPRPGAYRPLPMFSHHPSRELQRLAVAAAFVEVTLAKHGHAGEIGINLLEKIQPPTLPVLFGAILAGVDWVCVGAGIPRSIPQQLDRLARREASSIQIATADGDAVNSTFDPGIIAGGSEQLPRPRFLAIIASHVLAQSLARSGGVDGFVVEGPSSGGHNAPPRGGGARDRPPVYGPRDQPDLERLARLGLPFWLAGGFADHERLREAWTAEAQGVQIGTAFAFCRQSGIDPELRRKVLHAVATGRAEVVTEALASPTGFPFKVLCQAGSEGGRDPAVRTRRPCTLGYLRHAYHRPDGGIAWRCPAEPVADYLAKGGERADTQGRRCVCHGLLATASHAHATGDGVELPLITAGESLLTLGRFLRPDRLAYDADDVIDAMFGVQDPATAAQTSPCP